MFVRWRKRGSLIEASGTAYYAYLVESKRIDGKPRQKNRGYLGSIREQKARWSTGKEWRHGYSSQCTETRGDLARAGFYTELRLRMKYLQLTDAQQASIEQQVSKTVPHMTPEQCESVKREKHEQQTAANLAYFKSLHRSV